MAEPFTIGGIIAAAVLFSPAAREHDRLKTIAYTASKYHKSPEAARSAFFRMANSNHSQIESVDRVDSLTPAHVRPASPTQLPDNFTRTPIPVNPDVHHQASDNVASDDSPHDRTSVQNSRVPRFLPDHCRKAIDEKWAAKKASKDARYQRKCDKLDHKYGGTEGKRKKQQQRIDDKHRKRLKSLELKRCMEVSMGEWKARLKAEKQRKKGLSTENALPAEFHASTDGAGEQPSQQATTRSRLSSYYRMTRDSASDEIFSFTTGGWQPTMLTLAVN